MTYPNDIGGDPAARVIHPVDQRLHRLHGTNRLVLRWFVRGQPEPYCTFAEAMQAWLARTDRRRP